jgi:putative tricarboxylic transport membrane protein
VVIGSYSLNNNIEDVLIMIAFGILGYFMRKFDYDAAPLILALVLSPMMEKAFRQSLIISHGSFFIFITRPISATLLGITIILLLHPVFPRLRFRRKFERLKPDEG